MDYGMVMHSILVLEFYLHLDSLWNRLWAKSWNASNWFENCRKHQHRWVRSDAGDGTRSMKGVVGDWGLFGGESLGFKVKRLRIISPERCGVMHLLLPVLSWKLHLGVANSSAHPACCAGAEATRSLQW